MRDDATRTEIGSLLPLVAGDLIHVTDPGCAETYEGVIEVTAPHLNVLWIRTSAGERKLVDADRCLMQRVD